MTGRASRRRLLGLISPTRVSVSLIPNRQDVSAVGMARDANGYKSRSPMPRIGVRVRLPVAPLADIRTHPT